MLYTELQLRKSETIGEMFSVAHKLALAEGSAQESQYRKKEKATKALLTLLDKRGKSRTRKTEVFTTLNMPKESLVTIIKESMKSVIPL